MRSNRTLIGLAGAAALVPVAAQGSSAAPREEDSKPDPTPIYPPVAETRQMRRARERAERKRLAKRGTTP